MVVRAWIDCSPAFIDEADLPRWLPRGWKIVGSMNSPIGVVRLVIENENLGEGYSLVEATIEVADTPMSRTVTVRFRE
jgi:hypothetical protein